MSDRVGGGERGKWERGSRGFWDCCLQPKPPCLSRGGFLLRLFCLFKNQSFMSQDASYVGMLDVGGHGSGAGKVPGSRSSCVGAAAALKLGPIPE
jgi:hypothetical protein